MNKPHILLSIAISLLVYSIGLTLYGSFGVINTNKELEKQEQLIIMLQDVSVENTELTLEYERLQDPEYISNLAKEYGLTGGETIIYLPAHNEDAEVTPTRIIHTIATDEANKVSNTLLLAISALIGFLFFLILTFLTHRIPKKSSSD